MCLHMLLVQTLSNQIKIYDLCEIDVVFAELLILTIPSFLSFKREPPFTDRVYFEIVSPHILSERPESKICESKPLRTFY
jgi:hypothetical protein